MSESGGLLSWELDKKLPLAFIFLLLSQLVLGAWFVSKFDSRLTNLENEGPKVVTELLKLQAARETMLLQETEIKGSISNIQTMLGDLRNRSDRRTPEFKNDPGLNRGNYNAD